MRRRDVHEVVDEVLSRPTGRPITMMLYILPRSPLPYILPRSPLPQLPDSDRRVWSKAFPEPL